jgi:hypothetical protein
VLAYVSEFIFRQAAQVCDVELAFLHKIREDLQQSGVPVVILAVDLLTKLRQVALQFPQLRRVPDLRGHFLC